MTLINAYLGSLPAAGSVEGGQTITTAGDGFPEDFSVSINLSGRSKRQASPSIFFMLFGNIEHVCNVCMVCWWDIYDSIAPKPRLFSSEVNKCSRARFAARGHLFTEDEKRRG